MTDTPRTQAELLSIFADQQDHGITAQDMRDFVTSSNPDPLYRAFAGYSVTHVGGDTALATIPAGGATGFGVGTLIFPFGANIASGATQFGQGLDYHDNVFSISNDDPDVTWGPVDAGNAFMFPPGAYGWTFEVAVLVSEAFTFPFSSSVTWPFFAGVDQGTYDSSFSGPTDGTVPWIYPGWANSIQSDYVGPSINTFPLGQDPGEQRSCRTTGVFINDTSSPRPMICVAYGSPGMTSDMHVAAYYLNVWRLR